MWRKGMRTGAGYVAAFCRERDLREQRAADKQAAARCASNRHAEPLI
jgi:hypothetical protein